jgi:hypothetical protein
MRLLLREEHENVCGAITSFTDIFFSEEKPCEAKLKGKVVIVLYCPCFGRQAAQDK